MDFRLTDDHRALVGELRSYLQGLDLSEVRADYARDPFRTLGPSREFLKRLSKDGWLGLNLPAEVGGSGRTAIEQWLFLEEMSYQGLPTGHITTSSIAPTLSQHGNEEQRSTLLPAILAGELEFAIGYSEPEAGTDLASLQTRAVRTSDGYMVNGRKVFTTGADYGTHLWLAARTGSVESRHRGISLFIVPLPEKGITVHPLTTQGDEHTTEIFIDDVLVPDGALLGEENGGWEVITTQLDHERLFPIAMMRADFDRLIRWQTDAAMGQSVFEQEVIRQALAELGADLEVARLLSMRAAWLIDQGETPYVEASMAKVWYSELRQRLALVGLDILGPSGQVHSDDKDAPAGGVFERGYRSSTVPKFGAGTNEVQRQIIAQRGLGLPRANTRGSS